MVIIYFRLRWRKMNRDYCNKNQSRKNGGKMMMKVVRDSTSFGAISLK